MVGEEAPCHQNDSDQGERGELGKDDAREDLHAAPAPRQHNDQRQAEQETLYQEERERVDRGSECEKDEGEQTVAAAPLDRREYEIDEERPFPPQEDEAEGSDDPAGASCDRPAHTANAGRPPISATVGKAARPLLQGTLESLPADQKDQTDGDQDHGRNRTDDVKIVRLLEKASKERVLQDDKDGDRRNQRKESKIHRHVCGEHRTALGQGYVGLTQQGQSEDGSANPGRGGRDAEFSQRETEMA